MKLRDIAHSRAGDKGDISNLSLIAYKPEDYPRLREAVTAARVKEWFKGIALGAVTRYEMPNVGALNFVLERSLGGGVTRSLALDMHGKSLSFALLEMELEEAPPPSCGSRREERAVKKVVALEKIDTLVRRGTVVMSAGFLGCGAAETLIDRLVALKVRDLTLISSDTAMPDRGAGKLIVNGCVKKLLASHIGTNPETIRRMNEGSLEVEFVPQGTLAERIRAGGFGLGGVLTPTGIGTIVEEGKTKLRIEGKEYLLELPLRAEVALIKGSIVDESGNVYYRGTAQNFNAVMAMAADTVIVEAERLVPVGELPREWVMTPGIVVDFIVTKGGAA